MKKTARKVSELKEIVIKELPALFREEPELRLYVASLFKDQFPDKNETEKRIEELYREIRDIREESARRWEEHSKRFEEHTRILEGYNKRFDEQNRRLEEQNKRLEEQNKRLEEQNKRLEEHSRRLEEHSKILEEHSRRLEEQSKILQTLMEELKALRKRQDVQIGALGARWGLKSERAFRNALKGILEESFPVKVERYTAFDAEGEVFDGHPGELVELDLIIRDGELIVAELKSSLSIADVWLFQKKVNFFEKKEGKKPSKKIIISPMIDPKAESLIKKLGIVAYSDIPDSEEEL